jgi:hypothetical protein
MSASVARSRGRWALVAFLAAGCGSGDPRRARVEGELLGPYAARLAAGDWAGARDAFTTSAYRGRVPDAVFLAGQARNRDTWGGLTRLRLAGDALEEVEDPVDGDVLRAVVLWEGGSGSAEAVFDLQQESGQWKITRSWYWPSGGSGVERVF